jgi:hypothetical protein
MWLNSGTQRHQCASSLPLQNYIRTYFSSSSGDPSFVAVANGARAAGRDYVEAVKESVKVAGLGVAFAADVMNLCDYLSKGPDAALRSFIDEMRTIAQRAQIEADATNHKFRDIRKRLVQVCCKLQSALELLTEASGSS